MARHPLGPRVTLQITEQHINEAIPRDSKHCMIADAVKAAVPHARFIAVDLATIRFTDPRRGLRFTYMTPRIAQAHLVRFDQGLNVSPFQFQLRGAQVTKSGRSSTVRTAALRKGKRSKLVDRRGTGVVAERVGGQPPPLQPGKDGVPFSRRRAFGLRALEY